MSGGRATVGARRGKVLNAQAGDITATHEAGHVLTNTWFIECKRVADLNYASFMLFNKGLLASFWQEACDQAAKHGKMPMLIAREDRGATTIIVANAVNNLPMNMRSDVFMFHWSTQIARVHKLNVDLFDFDAVMGMPFIEIRLPAGARWLRPGEDPFAIVYQSPPPRSAPKLRRIRSKYNGKGKK